MFDSPAATSDHWLTVKSDHWTTVMSDHSVTLPFVLPPIEQFDHQFAQFGSLIAHFDHSFALTDHRVAHFDLTAPARYHPLIAPFGHLVIEHFGKVEHFDSPLEHSARSATLQCDRLIARFVRLTEPFGLLSGPSAPPAAPSIPVFAVG